MTARRRSEDYWNRNIAEWGKFYLSASHPDEEFDAPGWLRAFYRSMIVPLEARLMGRRFGITLDFISRYVRENMTVVDVGCGNGIFTVELLRQGAAVKAVDSAPKALELTKALVEKLLPDHADAVEYLLLDVTRRRLPESDLAIAMGVTPYVGDLGAFYGNILPTTKMFYCLVLDPRHWANRVRSLIPALNVRHLHWFERSLVDSLLEAYGWQLLERCNFASGYLDIAARSASPHAHAHGRRGSR